MKPATSRRWPVYAQRFYDSTWPPYWELPLSFEVRDGIVRQIRRREAIYLGLDDGENAYRKARAKQLATMRRSILRRVKIAAEAAERSAQRAELFARRFSLPLHTCAYWRGQDGYCSMCGRPLGKGNAQHE